MGRFEEYLLLNEGIKGAQWEEVITIAWNSLLWPEKSIEEVTKDSKLELKKSYIEYIDTAVSIAKNMKSYIGNTSEKMVHSGKGGAQITRNWSNWGGVNKTPKTDAYVGNKYMSFKKFGGKSSGQLMSGKGGETIATFYAAFYKLANYDTHLLNSLTNIIETKFTDSFETGKSIRDIKKGKGDDPEITKKVKDADRVHKELKEEMKKIFENNKDLIKWFSYEAMTGEQKFGKSWAAANWMFVFDENGEVKKLKPIDDKMASSVAKNVEIDINFKSSKGSSYTAFRSAVLNSSKEWSDIRNNLLLEGCSEFTIEEKFSDFIKNTLKKIENKVKELWNMGIKYFLDFFGLEVVNIKVNDNGWLDAI